MGLSEATSLAIESWTLYAIAILTVAARLCVHHIQPYTIRRDLIRLSRASRTILLGSVRKWQIDDYIMMVIGVRCPFPNLEMPEYRLSSYAMIPARLLIQGAMSSLLTMVTNPTVSVYSRHSRGQSNIGQS